MGRRELIALKLQMGINPSVQIAPSVLRAMWRQLKAENVNAQRNQPDVMSQPIQVTPDRMVV